MQLEVITSKPKSSASPTPILFVHGAYCAAWCWDEYFLPYFAKHGYTAYALSLRGHGASEGRLMLPWTSIDDYVADIKQLVDQLKKQPVLIGHSMGGYVIQKYLESYDPPAVVLIAPVPHQGTMFPSFRLAQLHLHPLFFYEFILTQSPKALIKTPELAKELLFSENIPDEKMKRYFSLLQEESYRAFFDMARGLTIPWDNQRKIHIFVLGAGNDKIFSPEEIKATANVFGTQAEFLNDMAHLMILETRWQALADRIIDWLRKRDL